MVESQEKGVTVGRMKSGLDLEKIKFFGGVVDSSESDLTQALCRPSYRSGMTKKRSCESPNA